MKSTPFNNNQNYAPIPFDQEFCQLALELKEKGLKWHPHVGCFVWDPEESIPVPSPFPQRIYFILNLNHFLKIFGSLQNMKEKLVWIPTWQQARQLCNEMEVSDERIKQQILTSSQWDSRKELILLLKLLKEKLPDTQIKQE
jgi:hypothetical protein